MDEKITEKKPLIPKLQLILTVLAVLAPLFYLTGLSFHQGLLTTYGISSDTFPITVQDTYVSAYIAISHFLLPLLSIKEFLAWMVTWEGVLVIVSFVLIISILLFLLKKILSSKIYQSLYSLSGNKLKKYHWDNNDFSLTLGLASIISYLVFVVIYIPFGLFCLWILPSILGNESAKNLASNNIEQYLQKGCHYETDERWGNCKILQSKDGRILYEGILIASSETRIAFFTKAGAVVAQIPDGAFIINKLRGL